MLHDVCSPHNTKEACLIHKHDTFAMKNNKKFDILSRMPKKRKRAWSIGMNTKTRTPHQIRQKSGKHSFSLNSCSSPRALCFLNRKEEERIFKKKKKPVFQSRYKLRQNDFHSFSQVCQRVIFYLTFTRHQTSLRPEEKSFSDKGENGTRFVPMFPFLLATLHPQGY